jgi:FkbM family methyltransferase
MRNYLINLLLTKEEKFRNSFNRRYYSQCGEDAIVKYIFQLRNVDQPSYIDIGAHHPYLLSNTAYFYERGCRGINIEANPNLINEFLVHRPKDINLNVGISGKKGEQDFFILSDPTLSTFSEAEAQKMSEAGRFRIVEVKKIALETTENILSKYRNNVFPDFLSLDVEGLDLEILQSIDFQKYWPKVVCVEAADYSPIGAGARRDDLVDFIKSKGYFEYANTNLNAIMVKNQFWFI